MAGQNPFRCITSISIITDHSVTRRFKSSNKCITKEKNKTATMIHTKILLAFFGEKKQDIESNSDTAISWFFTLLMEYIEIVPFCILWWSSGLTSRAVFQAEGVRPNPSSHLGAKLEFYGEGNLHTIATE